MCKKRTGQNEEPSERCAPLQEQFALTLFKSSCRSATRPGSLFTLCPLLNAFTDVKSPATPKMTEHPLSLHLFQLYFIFLLTNTELTGED